MRRTKQGLLLEKLLSGMKHRHVLCFDGDPEASYDCGCCITYPDDVMNSRCGCSCHRRIEHMANAPDISFWLLALEAMGEFHLSQVLSGNDGGLPSDQSPA